MRPLTDKETEVLFNKLASYCGSALKTLIAPPSPLTNSSDHQNGRFVFRLQDSRVYYVSLQLANLATCVSRENLLSLGTYVKSSIPLYYDMELTDIDVLANSPNPASLDYILQLWM